MPGKAKGTRKKIAKNLEKGLDNILFHAALESMSDAFTVWDDNLNLVSFNKKYEEIYFSKVGRLKVGMSLREVCELSVQNGNEEGMDAEQLYEKYSNFLKKMARKEGIQVYERKFNGKIFRSTFIKVPGVGQIVTQKDITQEIEQKKIEEEKDRQIAEQNIWIKEAIDSMSQGLCVFDKDKRLIMCNKSFAKIYKLPKSLTKTGTEFEKILKYRIKRGLVPEGMTPEEHMQQRMELAKSQEREVSFVEIIKGRHIRVLKNPTSNGGWIGVIRDISEEVKKRQIEREKDKHIAEQNMLINAAISNMSHGLSMYGPDQKLIISNDIYAKFYGLPKKMTKPGTKFKDILKYRLKNGMADENENEIEFLKKRLEFVDGVPVATDYVEKVGKRLISVIRRPMPGGGWVATHQDVTEQYQKEKIIEQRSLELEQQNMRFDAAVNNMSQGLSMFDKDHKLIICNKPFAKLYKLPKKLTKPGVSFWEILDHGAKSNLVSIADREERYKILSEVINAKEPVTGPITMLNGQIIFINHQPLKDGGWLSTHEDITEQYQKEEIIRHMAKHDGLTGLLNRRAFHDILQQKEKAIKSGKELAILCIDLDHFKPINDNFGHATGDGVLKTISERIDNCIKDFGVTARLGGDEFAALIDKKVDVKLLEEIAQNILRQLAKPVNFEEIEVIVGGSIGIAIAPKDGKDSETLMHHADLALYQVKSEGRGNYCFFENSMAEKQKRRATIESGLKSAIDNNELHLYYQPLISLSSNQISCCEALMRWEPKNGKKYPPTEFIPVAEETGLIREMGYWALFTACNSAVKWDNNVRVAVNVSPIQFSSDDLIEQVAFVLDVSGLEPNRLELEITESVSLDENDRNLEILYKLKSMGVRIALDDFGTGFSSLSYLRSFPFDKVKIDRSFISSLDTKPESIAIIKAVVDIGESLNMSVTAEGIETEEQLRAVFRQNCDEVQGYLFSPPLPQNSIEKLLCAAKSKAKKTA